MIIDSDDEEPAAKTKTSIQFVDKPEFEAEEDETAGQEIMQSLDLTLGAAVLNVAVLSTPYCTAANAPSEILREKMVFAVSCSSDEVYVVTLPLTPPSPTSLARPELREGLLGGRAGSGAWGESLVLLGGQSKRSDGIAIALPDSKASQRADRAHAIVASHSREAAGTLRLWNVPLDQKGRPSRAVEPFQVEYLPKPLTSILFNPTHRTQLLAVSATDAVRVYDYALPSLPPDPDTAGPYPTQGSWLLSLYQPFAKGSSSRKPFLDAAWIAHGRAVFALLADGMWGIWDIGGVSPLPAGVNVPTKLKSGVKGAALTVFSVSGYLEGSSSLRSGGAQNKDNRSGDFAPMTPHTRKQATSHLTSSLPADRLSTIHGGLKVSPLPSNDNTLQDESVALWVGSLDHVYVVPAVSRFWDSQLRKGSGGGVNLFSGAQPTRMIKVGDLHSGLVGEHCCGIDLVLSRTKSKGDDDSGLPVDAVVQGESRIVFVQQSQDSPTLSLVSNSRKRVFSKGERSSAIIVKGQQGRISSKSYDLSTFKAGSLRQRPSIFAKEDQSMDGDDTPKQSLSRPRGGFEFTKSLNEAADASADISRDVDLEMLDIMQIDQALDTMEDSRGSGRKKVFFEED